MNATTAPAKKAPKRPGAAKAVSGDKPAPATTKKAKIADSGAKPAAAPKRRASQLKKPLLDAGQRAQYISVAAYYIAERRGFQGSYELEDWTRAETEIDNLLREGKLSS